MLAVFAQMMDRGDVGGGWSWWWLVGLAVTPAVVVLVAVVAAHAPRDHTALPQVRRRSSAEDVQAGPFARGEVDADEYRRRRDALRG
jgi:putative membrane protein